MKCSELTHENTECNIIVYIKKKSRFFPAKIDSMSINNHQVNWGNEGNSVIVKQRFWAIFISSFLTSWTIEWITRCAIIFMHSFLWSLFLNLTRLNQCSFLRGIHAVHFDFLPWTVYEWNSKSSELLTNWYK